MKYLILIFFISCQSKGVFLISNEKDARYINSQYFPRAEQGDIVILDVPYQIDTFIKGEWFDYQSIDGYKERALPFKTDSFSTIEWSNTQQDSIKVLYKYIGTCQ